MTDKHAVMISESPKLYETTDISHAAILMTVGVKYISISSRTEKVRNNTRTRTVFQLERVPNLSELLAEIMNKTIEVNAAELLHHLRELKTISHNHPGYQNG